MSWDYRIVRQEDKRRRNGVFYEVCEVYYNEHNEPYAFCQADICGDTLKELFMKQIPHLIEGMRRAYLSYPYDFVKPDIEPSKPTEHEA